MPISRKIVLAALIGLAGLAPRAVLAQQAGNISGRVVDATTSLAINGAVVVIEGTRRGTTAEPDGSFTISGVPVGTFQVTARVIGYAPVTHEVTVAANQTVAIEFSLTRQAVVMDEIVVTGYGAQERKAITGSIASVDATEANVGVTNNADDLIKGRVAGVNITQNNGEAGAGVQIRIRGGTSISASNDPLYVIDGVAIQNVATEARGVGIGGDPSLPRNPLNLLNPNDIESITILKDAAAAAIYGARGANGVILIETKQGQRDRTTFEYDGYVSVASRANSLDLLTGSEYRQFVTEQVAAGNLSQERLNALGSADNNWQDAVTRTAITQNHNLVFSGGTESSQYRASLNYLDEEGVAIGDGLKRYQARLNGTHYAWDDRLQLRINLTASHTENDYLPFQDGGGFEGDVFHNMVNFDPTQPVKVTDAATGQEVYYEIGGGVQSVRNPVAIAEQLQDFASTTRTLGNIRAQLDVIPDLLSGQLIVGVDRSESTRRTYIPGVSPVGAQWNGLARQQNRETQSITLQGLATLTKAFGGSDLEVVGGYEFNEFETDDFGAEARDFLTDAFSFDNLSGGAQLVAPNSFKSKRRLIGLFSRTTFGLNDRYFITGVARYDGSSVFGADNKWGFFPAVSASWRLSEEDFLLDGPFSELRLRVGYGLQGIEAVPAYASLLTLQPSDGDSYPFGDAKTVGVAGTQNPNPDLKWERTKQFNVGIDYGFADNRISGSFEYYVKNTSDLLLQVSVPQPAIVATQLQNIGKVRNRGIEANLDALLVNSANMTWEAGLVFAAEKNEVQDLGGQSFITTAFVSGQGQSGQVAQRIIPGYALGTFFGPEFTGVDANGVQMFNDYDANGNLVGETATPGGEDFKVIGDANPDFTLGLRSRLTVGRFDASLLARSKVGMDVFNNTALVYSTKSNALQGKNFLGSALDDPTGITQPAIYSSRWIEDGSFIRLENITVGYNVDLPEFVGQSRNARIYLSADNLFLITGYSGYDPEAHTSRGNLAVRGIDYLAYPRARSFTAGVRFSF